LRVVGKGGDERLAPLSQRAVDALDILRRHLPQHPRPADYVFRTPQSPGTRLSRAPLAVRFKALCKQVGLPANTHPHQLRHSAAQYSLSRGMPFSIVSKYLGHRWIQTTQIYARATPIEAFEAYFKIHPKFETFGFGDETAHEKA
jgi:site-specific recombinase XerD